MRIANERESLNGLVETTRMLSQSERTMQTRETKRLSDAHPSHTPHRILYSRVANASTATCRSLQPLSIDRTLVLGDQEPGDRKQRGTPELQFTFTWALERCHFRSGKRLHLQAMKATSRTASLVFPSSCFIKQNSCLLLKLRLFLLQRNLSPIFIFIFSPPSICTFHHRWRLSFIKYIHAHLPLTSTPSFIFSNWPMLPVPG